MQIKNTQKRSEAVSALSSTIQRKIVSPAAGKVNIINLEITEINQKITNIENELSLLAAAHKRTRALAVAALLGAAVLGTILCLFASKIR